MKLNQIKIFAIVTLALASTSFCITSQATSQACDTAVIANKIPSNNWIGALDTPADKNMLDKYCFYTNYTVPSSIAGIVSAPGIVIMLVFAALSREKTDSK
jgi:hypothetical protein